MLWSCLAWVCTGFMHAERESDHKNKNKSSELKISKTKLPKKNKLKGKFNKRKKKTCGLFFVDKILLGMVSALGYGWFTQWHSIRELSFPLCCQVSTTNNFLVKNGSPCPFSTISAGASCGLSLCRSYVCCHSLWSLSVHHFYSAWNTLGNHPSLLAFTILLPLLCVIFPNDHLNFSDISSNITFLSLIYLFWSFVL